jgi:hypothetical protein
MGKRKRRVRVLKECNRSKRLGKVIGRALAGVVDPAAGFADPATPPWPAVDLAELAGLVNDPRKPGDLADEGKAMVWLSDTVGRRVDALLPRGWFLIKPV